MVLPLQGQGQAHLNLRVLLIGIQAPKNLFCFAITPVVKKDVGERSPRPPIDGLPRPSQGMGCPASPCQGRDGIIPKPEAMGKVVEAGTIEWSCQQLKRQPIQAFDSQGIATQRNRLSKSQLKSFNTRPH